MVLRKSGRGSVGRAFAKNKKYKEDEEWREKQKERKKEHYHKHKDREVARSKEWTKRLNEFANKRCKKCDKLLNYRNKSGFCRKHWVKELGEIRKEWKKKNKKER